MPSLEATGLTKRYGDYSALFDATFRYEGGAAIGYLGPNGAGKTTTLKLFTGLLVPTSGSALINGVEVARNHKEALWRVGSVIETPEPYPALSSRDTLTLIGRIRGLAPEPIRDRIDQYSKELHLPPLDKRSANLSKGQKQRVVLAAAFMTDPEVLLLDEPTSGLDPAERVIIRDFLIRIKHEKRLILMSSHLLQEVTEICDRVIFINEGKILLQESVENIEKRFRSNHFEVEFDRPMNADLLARIPGVRRVEALTPTRFRLETDGNQDRRSEVLSACQRLATVTAFGNASLTLEEAYLRLISRSES